MMEETQSDVVVIGAGISGLSVAHWLHRQGIDVRVLERDEVVGGTMKTVNEQGFLAETGPNSALETTPLIRELVRECGIEDEFEYANPASKNRYILKNGSLHALPLSPPAFLGTKLFSVSAKLRLLAEPFIGRAEKEESIAEFVERRLGREFLDYAIDPFVAGIFAGRPESLSVRAAFPKLYALEDKYGGLIKGMIMGRRERKARAEKAKDRAESFSFKGGMQTFPLAIARLLGPRVLTGTIVQTVTRTGTDQQTSDQVGSRFRIVAQRHGAAEVFTARFVVMSVPAYAAADMLQQLTPETSTVLDSIFYPPVASIYTGFRQEQVHHSVDGFGFLVPSRERRQILGSLWSSSLFGKRAPDGMVSMTTFMGGGRQPELLKMDDNALCDLALTELRNIMQIEGKGVYLRVTRWDKAIPQYELGYGRTIAALERCQQHFPGMLFCSNFLGGISVGDCVKNSNETAQRIVSSLIDQNHERT